MIESATIKGFRAVPYLETSALCLSHPEGFTFSSSKPTVIVGPNGAGKSALLKALSLFTLTHRTCESALDDHYLVGNNSEKYWDEVEKWSHDYVFLQGLTCVTDNAPALFYRPGRIPGNYEGITHAMICGYSKEAQEHRELVYEKSSGQQSQALLCKLQNALRGEISELKHGHVNWRFGKDPRVLEHSRYYSDFDYQAEILKKMFSNVSPQAKPLILMDEPEQSLDAKAELQLWRQIAEADCSKIQVILASHSLFPLMHPELFSIIEAVPGYLLETRAMI